MRANGDIFLQELSQLALNIISVKPMTACDNEYFSFVLMNMCFALSDINFFCWLVKNLEICLKRGDNS